MDKAEKLMNNSCKLAAELIKSAYTQGVKKKLEYDPNDCILGFTIAATEIARNRGSTDLDEAKEHMHRTVDLAYKLIEIAMDEAGVDRRSTGIGLILNLTKE
jgi:hypothetical protein